jgi:hypothetical protein
MITNGKREEARGSFLKKGAKKIFESGPEAVSPALSNISR